MIKVEIEILFEQGWGMVDGMHAVVFVDNHDNQVPLSSALQQSHHHDPDPHDETERPRRRRRSADSFKPD